MKNKYTWAIGVIVLLVIVVGYSLKPKEISEIKIGGLFALSDYAAFAGEASRDGFLLAIKDSGMKVDYVVEDFQSNNTKVVTAGRKLMEDDKVQVIIGPEWDNFGEALTPIAEKNKVLLISPWGTSEAEWTHSEYYFDATPSERMQARKLLEYFSSIGVKSLALLYVNDSWAIANGKYIMEEAQKLSNKIVVHELKTQASPSEFRGEILKIKELNPDAVFTVIADPGDQGTFIKQFRELGLTAKLAITNSNAEEPKFLVDYKAYLPGVIYPYKKEYKNTREFNEKFVKEYGHEPGAISAATAYDMTTLVLNAYKAGAKTSDDVIAYLKNVKDYEGYSNLINFNEWGQVAVEEIVIKQITEGEPKILAE